MHGVMQARLECVHQWQGAFYESEHAKHARSRYFGVTSGLRASKKAVVSITLGSLCLFGERFRSAIVCSCDVSPAATRKVLVQPKVWVQFSVCAAASNNLVSLGTPHRSGS